MLHYIPSKGTAIASHYHTPDGIATDHTPMMARFRISESGRIGLDTMCSEGMSGRGGLEGGSEVATRGW